MRSSQRSAHGFTLIELLIVVAIIGLLTAMLIPNLLDAMMKTKQKKTVGEIHIIGTAMMSWLTDHGSAAAAGASNDVDFSIYTPISLAALRAELVPQYLQNVPPIDGWKKPYSYYLDAADPLSQEVMGIRSSGRDGVFFTDNYPTGGFDPTDYDQDIAWVDGFFVRWPQKLT